MRFLTGRLKLILGVGLAVMVSFGAGRMHGIALGKERERLAQEQRNNKVKTEIEERIRDALGADVSASDVDDILRGLSGE